MSVVNPEKGAKRPSLMLTARGFQNVQNNRDPIFVIISDQTLIRIGRVRSHHSVALERAFSRFVVRHNNFMAGLEGCHLLSFRLCG